MLGPPKTLRRDELILTSLERCLPVGSFYRHLDAALDLSFVRDWVGEKYAERGRPSIDPVVFFKLQLIMFFEGLRSERKLIETADLNIAHRWYLGYGFDESLPDHSSLTRIRLRLGLRLGLPIFRRFFEHVVELCQQAGLVWGKELLFDATRVHANADADSLMPRWYLQAKAHLDELFPGERPAPAAQTVTDTTPSPAAATNDETESRALARLPFAGTTAEQQLATQHQASWKLLEEYRLDPARPTTRGYHRTIDDWESTTDPDAAPMTHGGPTVLGYHDHYAVDGGKARSILAAFVTPADVMENKPLLDLLHRVCFRYHLRPTRVIADATYGTIENIRAVEDAGIQAYLAMRNLDERTGFYGPSRFTYNPNRDEYTCPQGQPLPFWRDKPTESVRAYRADAHTCWTCPVRQHCTASGEGRIVHRSFFAEYVERVKGYHETEAYYKAIRKRQVWVEPLFGEAKDWHGLRRFRLRGLWKVNCEALRIAAGQNLKRWLKARGWGHRHLPGGGVLGRFSPVSFCDGAH
jgi:transposase